ncbi:MAG TPA: hypothetical protein VKE51_04955 [Vicinamibacterales bacterium]|nr:hypothetical protein [Vicinamibacterales bacterium]
MALVQDEAMFVEEAVEVHARNIAWIVDALGHRDDRLGEIDLGVGAGAEEKPVPPAIMPIYVVPHDLPLIVDAERNRAARLRGVGLIERRMGTPRVKARRGGRTARWTP